METPESIIEKLRDMTEHGEIIWRRLNSNFPQHAGIETSLGPFIFRILTPMPVAGLLIGYKDDADSLSLMASFGSPNGVYELLDRVAPMFLTWRFDDSLPPNSEFLSEVLELLGGGPRETLQPEKTALQDKTMPTRTINDVVKVMEIRGDIVRSGMDVNDHLAEGWMLLTVYLDSVPSDHGPVQRPVYVLGWTGEKEPPSDRAAEEEQETREEQAGNRRYQRDEQRTRRRHQ